MGSRADMADQAACTVPITLCSSYTPSSSFSAARPSLQDGCQAPSLGRACTEWCAYQRSSFREHLSMERPTLMARTVEGINTGLTGTNAT